MKAICRKEDNCLIGLIGLNDMGRYEQYKELEYAIAADYRRNGFGAEAVRGMLDFGFRKLDLSVIAAWVHAANYKKRTCAGKVWIYTGGTAEKTWP